MVALQVTKKFARGWASLMDIFSDMMIKEIVPTATAVKQNLERLHTFGSLGGSLCDPEDVIAFLRAGGRRVPLSCRWPDLAAVCSTKAIWVSAFMRESCCI